MKNNFLAFLMLTAMFFGCKPRTQELTPYQSIDSKLMELAKVSFKQNQSIALSKSVNPVIKETDNRLNYWGYTSFRMFFPVWENSELLNLSNGNKVLITPLRRNLNVNYGNLYYIRRLRIEFDAQENLVNINIVELVTLKKSVASQKYQIIAHVFEEIETRTDAKIMIFDAGYNPLSQNTSWKGEVNNNTNLRNVTEGSSDGSDGSNAPNYCYTLTAVASCTDVQYLQSPAPCDDPSTTTSSFVGFGTPINNCLGGGSGPYTPPSDPNNPPVGVGNGGNGDTGQDQPFIPDFVDYNGVNIQLNYRNAQGELVSADTNIIKAFKFVIDNSTFRTIIKDYLPPNEAKLKITFDVNTRGGKFNPATNIISFNPNLLSQGYTIIDLVQILVHEGIHAMFAKPSTTVTTQITTARSNLVAYYDALPPTDPLYKAKPTDNMVQHETMGEYYLNDAVSILRAFYNSGIGKTQNNANITDDAYKSFFLGNLVQVETPLEGKTDIINMFISKLSQAQLSDADAEIYGKQFMLLRDSYK